MFLIIFIILLSFNFVASADEEIRIYVPGYKSDTIDYGMRFESDDAIAKTFFVVNNSSNTYYYGFAAPTFATYEGPSGNGTHVGFDWRRKDDRIVAILPGQTVSRQVLFSPFDLSEDESEFRIGMWDATLEIGLSTSRENIGNIEFIDFSKKFTLMGRVSNQDFDYWEKEVKFDSVFINSPSIEEKEINFRNNSENQAISLTKLETEVITSKPANDEFILEELSLPIELQARSSDPGNEQESVKISYNPINRGIDSALVNFTTSISNSISINSATITGIGVEQELSIDDCSEIFYMEASNYVIDLGNIDKNEVLTFNGTLLNTGNINFNGLSYSIDGTDLTGTIKIENSKTFSLEIGESLDFSATVTPISRGLIESDLLLESDAKSRKIGAYVEALHRFETIKIRANSIEPVLTTDILDTLDFGVVSGTPDCLDASTQEFVIRNTGTGVLEILNAFTSDLSVFDISLDTTFIDPKNQTFARINFLPGGDNIFRLYDQESLFLVTNMTPPNDTIRIPLKAIFASPGQTELTIKDKSFFPGTRLRLPVLVDGDRINLADRFSSTLSYEKTLMRYFDISTTGSASELAANTSFANIIEPGLLSISINIPQGENFKISDTLCFLEFDTFLGRKLESNMVFVEPKFGDQDCNSIIEVNSGVGIIKIDSLCNIDQFVHDNHPPITLRRTFPNPVENEISLEFLAVQDENFQLDIQILDYFGRVVIKNNYLLHSESKLNLSVEELPTGVYTILIENGGILQSRKFIKN